MDKVFKVIILVTITALIVFAVVVRHPHSGKAYRNREMVSRVRSDLRTVAIALESYFSDHELYPSGVSFGDMVPGTASELPRTGEQLFTVPPTLTTPVSYLTSLFPDVFQRKKSRGLSFAYYTDGKGWILFSPGPDQDYDITDPAKVYDSSVVPPSSLLVGGPWTFDPTNGASSSGDVWRTKQ